MKKTLHFVLCGLFAITAQAQLTFTHNLIDNSQQNANAANSVTTGDFDNDGDIDIVGAAFQSDVFTLFRNDGTGVFIGETIENAPAIANGARFVRAFDVNEDGFLDVLATSSSADVYVWFQNDGTGLFNTVTIDAGALANEAYGIDAADFDDDGDIDVVGGANNGDAVAVYANDGTGTFSLLVDLSGGPQTDGVRAVEVADLDEDGDPDILVAANSGDTYSWFENDGSGNFTNNLIGNSANANGASQIKAADLDGDGDLDVVGASNLADVFLWFENDGNENFTEQIIDAATFSNGPRGLVLSDLDQDGDIDAITASISQDTFAFYENDGSGNFTPNLISDTQSETNGAFAVTVGDMDGDSVDDVITAANAADIYSWYKVGGVLSVEDNVAANDIVVYPNPVSETLQIQLKQNLTIQQLKLTDVLGKSYDVKPTPSHTIHMESYAPGVYHLSVVTNKGTMSKKIVKQ